MFLLFWQAFSLNRECKSCANAQNGINADLALERVAYLLADVKAESDTTSIYLGGTLQLSKDLKQCGLIFLTNA